MGLNSQTIPRKQFSQMWNLRAFGVERSPNSPYLYQSRPPQSVTLVGKRLVTQAVHMAAVLLEVRDVVPHWGRGIPGQGI
jgi:hypothetical protein